MPNNDQEKRRRQERIVELWSPLCAPHRIAKFLNIHESTMSRDVAELLADGRVSWDFDTLDGGPVICEDCGNDFPTETGRCAVCEQAYQDGRAALGLEPRHNAPDLDDLEVRTAPVKTTSGGEFTEQWTKLLKQMLKQGLSDEFAEVALRACEVHGADIDFVAQAVQRLSACRSGWEIKEALRDLSALAMRASARQPATWSAALEDPPLEAEASVA